MPGLSHQWLLLWAARRMRTDGFVLGGFDGTAEQGGRWNTLPQTFIVGGKRPDAWGIRAVDGLLAFGEAKTAGDIDNGHTRAQLKIFGFTKMRLCGRRCPLFLASPQSSAGILDQVLAELDLLQADHIIRLPIPDILLEGEIDG